MKSKGRPTRIGMCGSASTCGLICLLIALPAGHGVAQQGASASEQAQSAPLRDAADGPRVASMNAALKRLADESAPSALVPIGELLVSGVYLGTGIHMLRRPEADVVTVMAGTLMLGFSGFFLSSAGHSMFGASTAAQARHDEFNALRSRGPLSEAALRVFEGQLYAQAVTGRHQRLSLRVGAIGALLSGIALVTVAIAAPEIEERFLVGYFGATFLALSGYFLFASSTESTAEEVWRRYHDGHITRSQRGAPSHVAIAPHVTTTGAGIALLARL